MLFNENNKNNIFDHITYVMWVFLRIQNIELINKIIVFFIYN